MATGFTDDASPLSAAQKRCGNNTANHLFPNDHVVQSLSSVLWIAKCIQTIVPIELFIKTIGM
jgi:hypothetical protein